MTSHQQLNIEIESLNVSSLWWLRMGWVPTAIHPSIQTRERDEKVKNDFCFIFFMQALYLSLWRPHFVQID